MADEPVGRPDATGGLVSRLVREAGITEAQARELISFRGPNWSSLLREARHSTGGFSSSRVEIFAGCCT
ncbi:hypothetical protein EJ076_33580 [Mesorhizobium sp. M7D.F.Ca.US.005.01.1.1]|nr:hypothetical protein EJ076_33580 [Mesorhizobium sp. M7D.F.Ca.US.005.01.1.1]